MGFSAVNTGNNLLFLMVSALLGFMTVSGILGWLNIRGLDIMVSFPDEIYDGQPTFVSVQLINRKKMLHSFFLRVVLGGKELTWYLLERNGSESNSLSLVFNGRGRKELGTAMVRSPFPINFFVRSVTLEIQEHFIVFPAPWPCAVLAAPTGSRARGWTSTRFKGYEGEVEKIVEYTGSEPLKMIHWRLSARHHNLKVKEMTAVADEPLLINVNLLPGKTFEENLSCAVYLVNRNFRAGRPVGLVIGETSIKPDNTRLHKLKLLTELALHGTH